MVETSGRKRNFLVVLPLFSSLSHNNSSFFFPRTCSVLLNSILVLWCVSASPPSYLITHSLLWEGRLLGNIPVDVWECNLTLSAIAIYTHVHIHMHKLSYLQEHSEVGVQNNGMLYSNSCSVPSVPTRVSSCLAPMVISVCTPESLVHSDLNVARCTSYM